MKRHYGKPFETSDFSSPEFGVRFKPNANVILEQIRTWLIFNNYSGSLTNLTGKIYSDAGGLIGSLEHTSTNSFNKADILTANSGVRSIYFKFNQVSLQKNNWYHFAMTASGYSFAESANIMWKQGFPSPVYSQGLSINLEALGTFPFEFLAIGDEL